MSHKKSDKSDNKPSNDFHSPIAETQLRLVTVAEEQKRLDDARRKRHVDHRLHRLRLLDSVFGPSRPGRTKTNVH